MRDDQRRRNRLAGQLWEDKAAAYLAQHGIQVLERGYRCRLGEIDIVGSDQETLVIVEVKARSRTRKGSALESVDFHKQRRIIRATRHFLMNHAEWHSRPVRFDVVAIDAIDSTNPTVTWLKHAFDSA